MGNKQPLKDISSGNLSKSLTANIPISKNEGINDLFKSKAINSFLSKYKNANESLEDFNQEKYYEYIEGREKLRSEVSEELKDLPLINKKLRIIQVVGSGATSSVLQVVDMESKRLYALKCVNVDEPHENLSNAEKFRHRENIKAVEGEVKILSKLKHPNIIRLIDTFVIDRNPILDIPGKHLCLQMEYVKGSDLDHLIEFTEDNRYHLSGSMVVKWFIILLHSVHYLHKKNICHFDLKPDNILCYYSSLEESSKLIKLKISDFGLSKDLTLEGRDEEKDGFNFSDQMPGNIFYSPLEILNSSNQVVTDPRKTDIWTLGLIFFQTYYRISMKTLVQAIENLMKEIQEDPELLQIFNEEFEEGHHDFDDEDEMTPKDEEVEKEKPKEEEESEEVKNQRKAIEMMIFILRHEIFKTQVVDPIIRYSGGQQSNDNSGDFEEFQSFSKMGGGGGEDDDGEEENIDQMSLQIILHLMLQTEAEERPSCETLLDHPIIKTWTYILFHPQQQTRFRKLRSVIRRMSVTSQKIRNEMHTPTEEDDSQQQQPPTEELRNKKILELQKEEEKMLEEIMNEDYQEKEWGGEEEGTRKVRLKETDFDEKALFMLVSKLKKYEGWESVGVLDRCLSLLLVYPPKNPLFMKEIIRQSILISSSLSVDMFLQNRKYCMVKKEEEEETTSSHEEVEKIVKEEKKKIVKKMFQVFSRHLQVSFSEKLRQHQHMRTIGDEAPPPLIKNYHNNLIFFTNEFVKSSDDVIFPSGEDNNEEEESQQQQQQDDESSIYLKNLGIMIQQLRKLFLVDELVNIVLELEKNKKMNNKGIMKDLYFLCFVLMKYSKTLRISVFSKNNEFINHVLKSYDQYFNIDAESLESKELEEQEEVKDCCLFIICHFFGSFDIVLKKEDEDEKFKKNEDLMMEMISKIHTPSDFEIFLHEGIGRCEKDSVFFQSQKCVHFVVSKIFHLLQISVVEEDQERKEEEQQKGEEEEEEEDQISKTVKLKKMMMMLRLVLFGNFNKSTHFRVKKHDDFVFPCSSSSSSFEMERFLYSKKKMFDILNQEGMIQYNENKMFEEQEGEGEGEDDDEDEEEEEFVTTKPICVVGKEEKNGDENVLGYYECKIVNGGLNDKLSFGYVVRKCEKDENEEGEEDFLYFVEPRLKKNMFKIRFVNPVMSINNKSSKSGEEETGEESPPPTTEFKNFTLASSQQASPITFSSGTVIGMGYTKGGTFFITCNGKLVEEVCMAIPTQESLMSLDDAANNDELDLESLGEEEEEDGGDEEVKTEDGKRRIEVDRIPEGYGLFPWIRLYTKNEFVKCQFNFKGGDDFRFIFSNRRNDEMYLKRSNDVLGGGGGGGDVKNVNFVYHYNPLKWYMEENSWKEYEYLSKKKYVSDLRKNNNNNNNDGGGGDKNIEEEVSKFMDEMRKIQDETEKQKNMNFITSHKVSSSSFLLFQKQQLLTVGSGTRYEEDNEKMLDMEVVDLLDEEVSTLLVNNDDDNFEHLEQQQQSSEQPEIKTKKKKKKKKKEKKKKKSPEKEKKDFAPKKKLPKLPSAPLPPVPPTTTTTDDQKKKKKKKKQLPTLPPSATRKKKLPTLPPKKLPQQPPKKSKGLPPLPEAKKKE